MMDAIEITVTRLPGGSISADAQMPATVLATVRLVAIAGSGRHRGAHAVYVSTVASSQSGYLVKVISSAAAMVFFRSTSFHMSP